MKKKTISFLPNALGYKNKKEGKMKKISFISLVGMVFIMTFALAISAYGADRLVVLDSPGGNTTFAVDQSGSFRAQGNLKWDAANMRLGVGTANPIGSLHLTDQRSGTRGLVTSQHSTDTQAAVIIFRKSRGTEAAPQALQNGDYVGAFHGAVYDGTNYIYSTTINYLVDGPVSTGHVPTALIFIVGDGSSRPERMRITSSGILQMAGGAYCTGTTWVDYSSREGKENIKDLSSDEALVALNNLNPVKFNYKADAEEKHVGFIAEDVPDIVATKDRKGLSALDIVAVLTRVVQEQKKMISELTEKVNRLEKQIEK